MNSRTSKILKMANCPTEDLIDPVVLDDPVDPSIATCDFLLLEKAAQVEKELVSLTQVPEIIAGETDIADIDHDIINIENEEDIEKENKTEDSDGIVSTTDEAASEENKDEMLRTDRKNARKRLRRPDQWKVNVRHNLHQSGKTYINVRGKTVNAKQVVTRKDCLSSCKFKCARKIGKSDQTMLFKYYYSLTQNEKYLFLQQNTEKLLKSRKTVDGPSRRQYSFKYSFKVREVKLQVCKNFFLGTLSISQKPVYTAHATTSSDSPKKSQRGKTSSRKISDDRIQGVVNHINKFKFVESHYCRATSNRKYLESTLNLPKMYDLYLIYCAENEMNNPVKLTMYRHIFYTKFNYGFHKPKKDLCEKCTTYYLKKKEKNLQSDEEENMQKHIAEKNAMRREKEQDKKSGIPVLCFDLENVITCPRTFVGNHFYLSKLTMYNFTAHLSTTDTTYCALWIETTAGRSGNCIASAFRKVVDRVLSDNHIEELITWSDSCVPQNRNSYISFCVLDILRNHPELKTLTMKYSIAGHSAVQEVDNKHSQIEKHMSQIEFYSPLSFVRELKKVNKRNPFISMLLRKEDFKNYEECASKLNYEKVPFTKISAIKFTNQDLYQVDFKKSYLIHDFDQKVVIYNSIPTLRRGRKSAHTSLSLENDLLPKVLSQDKELSKDKVTALKKMKPSMPEADKEFYKAFLGI